MASPSTSTAPTPAAVDAAAEALLAIFEAAREQASTRLSSPQLQALLVVQKNEGLNLRALADGVGMLMSSASRLCDRLIAAVLLERGVSRVDRREVSLSLTPYGHDVLRGLRDDRHPRREVVLARMAPAARSALLRGLREFTRVSNRNGVMELSA